MILSSANQKNRSLSTKNIRNGSLLQVASRQKPNEKTDRFLTAFSVWIVIREITKLSKTEYPKYRQPVPVQPVPYNCQPEFRYTTIELR